MNACAAIMALADGQPVDLQVLYAEMGV